VACSYHDYVELFSEAHTSILGVWGCFFLNPGFTTEPSPIQSAYASILLRRVSCDSVRLV
jgi:hypothetical protein